ncbi:ciliary microtubule-associated protein 2-like [Saccostrea cucullata]|uniref:ciliary microtubule-associated protein 2-like n=1 Tax=Saccostrea cuccullata TaxID=36930 RepID=UPI002ED273D1
MAEKKFNGAPFGTQTARFDVSGVHPKSKYPGTFTEIPYDKKSIDELNRRLAPGTYKVDVGGFNKKSVDERAAGPGWARAYEVERMAALPHLLHKDQWELKKLLQRKLAPGSYDIKDFLQVSDEKPRSIRGICQTRDQRFKENVAANETPGPGTYGKGGVPQAAVEEKAKKSTSTVGMLDAGSSTPRNLPTVGSELFLEMTKKFHVNSHIGLHHTRFFTRNFNPVGAGRYDVQKWEESQHKNGHGSVFQSKTGKLNAVMEKFLKERVRAKDVKLEDRVFLVTPEPPEVYVGRSKAQMEFAARRAFTVTGK